MMPPDDPILSESTLNKPLIGVAVAVALAAFGGWYFWHRRMPEPPAAAAAPAPVVATPPPEPAIEHPVPTDAAQTALPALGDSDAPLGAALSSAAGGEAAAHFLVPTDLIRHIVVTVDNLPRQKVAVDKRPVVATAGSFKAQGDEVEGTIDEANFQRYRPMIDLLAKADMQQVAAAYLRFYPLFQKVYQDLGYPNGYFNDRLVQVIDLLVSTPEVAGQIELTRPNVMYEFADPTLEGLPAGQKLMIRLGPDNAAVVKRKLRELREAVTASPPKR